MAGKKPKLGAKIVKHAHRRRFQEYVRKKGREKLTLAYVYWAMYLRSGKGNVFELAEELFLGDLGITNTALRSARRTLEKDGWVRRGPHTPKHAKRWTVYDDPATGLLGHPITQSSEVSALDYSVIGTVVLHSLDADASTSSSTPSASTPSGFLSESVSESVGFQPQEQKQPLLGSSPKSKEQNQPQPCGNCGYDFTGGEGKEFHEEACPKAARIRPVPLPNSMRLCGEEDVLEELALCFPAFRDAQPTVTEMLMMQEIIGRCDVYFLLPRTCMEYARKHKKDGLVPRSVKALHAAICGADVSTTNGLMAQTKQHEPQECWQCKAAAKDIMCKRCGKFSVKLLPSGEVSEFCGQCLALPSYRRESSIQVDGVKI